VKPKKKQTPAVTKPEEMEVAVTEPKPADAEGLDTTPQRMPQNVNSLLGLGLCAQPVGIGVWVFAQTLLHLGHAAALIGAGITGLGFILFWIGIFRVGPFALRKRLGHIILVVITSLGPTAGLTLGAITFWWIGLGVGFVMFVGGFVIIGAIGPQETQ
jgi:hypothetical protein